ncbi:MAG: UxaA family hydrolase [Lacunisphaera sp.]
MPVPAQPFESVARLPAAGDNVAIAVRRLEAGTRVRHAAVEYALPHTVLEGHRFAVRPIAPGEALRSWGHPFGVAIAPLAPGDYVANASILETLAVRALDGAVLPAAPNFADALTPFRLDEALVQPAAPVERIAAPGTFLGYRRPAGRGVGTRNTIVILGTSSRTASYARLLAARLQPLARVHPSIDGIVAVAHTEGGGTAEPNNALEVLRALAGFMVHANVGAVLAVDQGVEPINNARLRAFMAEHGYPLAAVPHEFLTLRTGLASALAAGESIVRAWLPDVAAQSRTPEPLAGLRLALQCGGSDAFSGVSGNPLAGAVAHELIRHGGTAVLAETDEAFGAEAYLVQNIRDLATARALVRTMDRFRERLSWHGVTAESNPSGGNKLRGLYNIALKSLGAVHKKDPRTRLDAVIDYGEPLSAPGFYFMNSPGNDLEGIAGQVAAGCNVFLFVTGNGSITNFPFAPTIKITTTTRRHELLRHEMDVNAGRYLDGEPMAALAAETFELLRAVASGTRTQGERAGHAQVSLWRDWRQTDTSRLGELQARHAPDGRPLPLVPAPAERKSAPHFPAWRRGDAWATDRIGLIVPTSMCSSQIARLAAERLNAQTPTTFARFVALPHTEGCGFGGASMHALLHRTYRGYATHPNVIRALFLEHGCEKVPNDVMRHELAGAGLAPEAFGWVSVQLDGGIARSLDRVAAWFNTGAGPIPAPAPIDFGGLSLGLLSVAAPTATAAAAFRQLARCVLDAGGSVLIPESDPLLDCREFRDPLLGPIPPHATLAYGQPPLVAGLHVVATETSHSVENVTGLGGCGVHALVMLVSDHAHPGHPFLPVLQVTESGVGDALPAEDVDVFLTGDAAIDAERLAELLAATFRGEHVPAAAAAGTADFQLTRGLLGVSA